MRLPVALLCLAVICVALLTGCPGPRAPEPGNASGTAGPPPTVGGQDGEKELTLWTIWNAEPRRSALNDIVAGFEKANPGVKVTVSNLEPDAYKTKIRVALGGDAPPDIFFVWSGEKMLTSFIRGGNCLDLTSYMDADRGAWRSRIIPGSLAPYIFEGKTWGVPYLLQCTFLFYNKDIIAQQKIALPKTWDDLLAVCRKLKAAGITPIALGNLEKWPAHHFPCVIVQRLIGHRAVTEQYNPLGPGDYNDAAWIRSLVMFQDLVKAGAFNANPNGMSRNDARMMFYTGKAAMFYTGTWDFAQFSKGGEAPEEFWDKWDFINFPSVPGGKGEQDALEGSADGYVISSKTRHPEEAVAFLQYLTSVDVAKEFVGKCKELVQVKGAVTEQNSSWYLAKYAKMVEQAKVISPWMDTLMEKSVADEYMNGVQGMLAGERTPQQVMEAVRMRQAAVKKEMGG